MISHTIKSRTVLREETFPIGVANTSVILPLSAFEPNKSLSIGLNSSTLGNNLSVILVGLYTRNDSSAGTVAYFPNIQTKNSFTTFLVLYSEFFIALPIDFKVIDSFTAIFRSDVGGTMNFQVYIT